MPFEVDPLTLQTIGESNFDGSLPPNSRYAAHYKIDPSSGNYCGFAIGMGKSMNSHVPTTMEHYTNGKLVYRKSHDIAGAAFAHDMAITDEYFIFLQSPVSFDPIPYILGTRGVADCINYEMEEAMSSKLLVIPRGDGEVVSIDIPKGYAYHFANAYKNFDGNLVVDIVFGEQVLMSNSGRKAYPDKPLWESMDFSKELNPHQLRRFRIDPKSALFLSQEIMTDACKTVDFPVINPGHVGKPYNYVYCLGSPGKHTMSAVQAVTKVDLEAGKIVEKFLPEPHQFLSELSFAPRVNSSQEDDGYLIGYMLDARKGISSLVIFDARQPSLGPVVKADLKYKIPFALHGTFVPQFTPVFTNSVRDSFPPNRMTKSQIKTKNYATNGVRK